MMSNIALKTTEAAGSAAPAPADSGDAGDTGAFDALLALQSMVGEDTVTEASAQLAGVLEGAELPESLDDSEDPLDEDGDASADDALSFLAALLPMPQKPILSATAAGTPASVSIQNDASPAIADGARLSPATGAGVADDLTQAISLNLDGGGAGSKAVPLNAVAAAPVIDSTTWTSLSGPAEMFSQSARQAVERVESAPLTTHVRDPRWADELGNRLASMVRTGESSASLQMTPVDLGPLEVNVAVRDNQATVHFGAASAETRALLEASIPRLREMLAAQGFQLMDSSVSHGFARQTRHEAAGTPRVDGIGESPMASAQTTHITGLLDLYA
jgi:flagellar hook-length control protein FliK